MSLPMNIPMLVDFIRRHQWAVEAVEATSSFDGAPQTTIIGVAVTDRLKFVFERSPYARDT